MDTYSANTSSPYYLAAAADVSAATQSVNSAAGLLPLSTSFWGTLNQVGLSPEWWWLLARDECWWPSCGQQHAGFGQYMHCAAVLG